MNLVASFSGVRGIYGKGLTDEIARQYAICFRIFLEEVSGHKNISIVVGYDTRSSSLSLKEVMIEGLNCYVYDVGWNTTPAIEHGVRAFEATGGIIITASHNEPEWNGFKFLDKDGSILKAEDMSEVIRLFNEKQYDSFENKEYNISIVNKSEELDDAYASFVKEVVGEDTIDLIKETKRSVVVDPNGGSGIKSVSVLRTLGIDVEAVNMNAGVFNRIVEPTKESISYLQEHVRANNSICGAGFDCDADRVEIVLENGEVLTGNHLLALCCEDYLKRNGRGAVVVNDATSYMVRDVVHACGGSLVETGVGETHVVSGMLESHAGIGGEGSSSGVIISPSRCRDGVMTLLSVLGIVARSGKKLSELVSTLPGYMTFRDKVILEHVDVSALKEAIASHYASKGYAIARHAGSVKVVIDDESFVWFRDSQTEIGAFRIISDSNDEEKSQTLLEEGKEVLLRLARGSNV